MKTKDMIAALAADRTPPATSPSRGVALAVIAGAAMAAVLFWLSLGLRQDFADAVHRAGFLYKFAITLALAIPATVFAVRSMRPGSEWRIGRGWLTLGPAMLAIGVMIELATAPAIQWSGRMIGTNAAICLTAIPLLSVAPAICLFAAMRTGAPMNPSRAGAICGLASASIAATLYAAHCTDDSPLFVAVWYSLAIAGVTVAGSIAGRWWLRW